LPVPVDSLTTCVLNTFHAAASGTIDLSTGASSSSISLDSHVWVTGNMAQPCPRCYSGGSPILGSSTASPGHGTCDRGPNAGGPCTTTNSKGLTRDCPTGAGDATDAGILLVDLTPLTTGTVTHTEAAGNFCTGQHVGPGTGKSGCFGSTLCRTIIENGSPAGAITPGVPGSATLASVFCIPPTGGLVDTAGDLPGPGATSLPGTFNAHN